MCEGDRDPNCAECASLEKLIWEPVVGGCCVAGNTSVGLLSQPYCEARAVQAGSEMMTLVLEGARPGARVTDIRHGLQPCISFMTPAARLDCALSHSLVVVDGNGNRCGRKTAWDVAMSDYLLWWDLTPLPIHSISSCGMLPMCQITMEGSLHAYITNGIVSLFETPVRRRLQREQGRGKREEGRGPSSSRTRA